MPKGKRYTSEFKEEAVKLAQLSHEPVAIIADELGIHYKTLCGWIRSSMDNKKSPSKIKNLQREYEALLAEHAKLKRKLKRTEQEREILKKAAAYFAQENQ